MVELATVAGVAKSYARDLNIGVKCSAVSGTSKMALLAIRQPTQKASRFGPGRGREITRRARPRRTRLSSPEARVPRSSFTWPETLPCGLLAPGEREADFVLFWATSWCTMRCGCESGALQPSGASHALHGRCPPLRDASWWTSLTREPRSAPRRRTLGRGAQNFVPADR